MRATTLLLLCALPSVGQAGPDGLRGASGTEVRVENSSLDDALVDLVHSDMAEDGTLVMKTKEEFNHFRRQLQEDYSDHGERISASVDVIVSTIETYGDPSWPSLGANVEAVGSLVAVTVPPPAGIIAGGFLGLAGKLMGIFGGAPSGPSNSDIMDAMSKGFTDMGVKLDELADQVKSVHDEVTELSILTEKIYMDVVLDEGKIKDFTDGVVDLSNKLYYASVEPTQENVNDYTEKLDWLAKKYSYMQGTTLGENRLDAMFEALDRISSKRGDTSQNYTKVTEKVALYKWFYQARLSLYSVLTQAAILQRRSMTILVVDYLKLFAEDVVGYDTVLRKYHLGSTVSLPNSVLAACSATAGSVMRTQGLSLNDFMNPYIYITRGDCSHPAGFDGPTWACKWSTHQGEYSSGFADGVSTEFANVEAARAKCIELGQYVCQAVTCGTSGKCTVRASSSLGTSASQETTYVPSPECYQTDLLKMVCTRFVSRSYDVVSNAAFWASQCLSIPDNAEHIKITMSGVTDYFKPVEGSTFCQMLVSSTRHQWSKDGVNWVTPEYSPKELGGSTDSWPKNNAANDERTSLSFWGSDTQAGGCCHNSYDDIPSWGRSFVVEICSWLPKSLTDASPPGLQYYGSSGTLDMLVDVDEQECENQSLFWNGRSKTDVNALDKVDYTSSNLQFHWLGPCPVGVEPFVQRDDAHQAPSSCGCQASGSGIQAVEGVQLANPLESGVRMLQNSEGTCLEGQGKRGGAIFFSPCDSSNKNQQWYYHSPSGLIGLYRTGGMFTYCLDADRRDQDGQQPHMWPCDEGNDNQKWGLGSDGSIKNRDSQKCLAGIDHSQAFSVLNPIGWNLYDVPFIDSCDKSDLDTSLLLLASYHVVREWKSLSRYSRVQPSFVMCKNTCFA